MSHLAIISLGGTISSVSGERTRLATYVDAVQMVDGSEILRQVPELSAVASTVTHRSVARRVSADLGPDDWARVAETVADMASSADPPDGVVITHGTATLEETAYALHLGLPSDLPVVVTGSQRPLDGISSDAAINLLDAATVALDEGVRGRGVVIVFDRKVWDARSTVKTDTFELSAFRSPEGPLAHIGEQGVRWVRSALRPSSSLSMPTDPPRIDIVPAYAGADGIAIDALVEAGTAGIVAEAFPPGMLPAAQVAAYDRAIAAGVPVVVTSRAHSGLIDRMDVYRPQGHVRGSDLRSAKARVLLMFAVAAGIEDRTGLQEIFDTY